MFGSISRDPNEARQRALRRGLFLTAPFLAMAALAATSRLNLEPPDTGETSVRSASTPSFASREQLPKLLAERRAAATLALQAGDTDRALALCDEVRALEAQLPGGSDPDAVRYAELIRRRTTVTVPTPAASPTAEPIVDARKLPVDE